MHSDLQYRKILGRYATSVAIVMFLDGDIADGVTVNSFASLSLDPRLILFCLKMESRHLSEMEAGRKFTVNFLSEEQPHLSRHFAGNREAQIDVPEIRGDGFVWLADTTASLFCTVDHVLPEGDHAIIVARVHDAAAPERAGSPLIFHGGSYAELKSGFKQQVRRLPAVS